MIREEEIEQILQKHVSADHLEEANSLVNNGKTYISTYSPSQAKVLVGGHEIHLSPSSTSINIQKTCPCIGEQNLCSHAVSALLAIKSHLSSKKRVTNRGITFWRHQVASMDRLALNKLVVDYAKRNKAFGFELRANAIGIGKGQDIIEQAIDLLDELKAPIIKSVRKPSHSQFSVVLNTARSLLAAANKLLDADRLMEGCFILIRILETAHYINWRKGTMDTSATSIINDCEAEISLRILQVRAPEVQYRLHDELIHTISKSYFQPLGPRFITEIFSLQKLQSQRHALLRAVESHIVRAQNYIRQLWVEIWIDCFLHQRLENTEYSLPELIEEDKATIWRKLEHSTLTDLPPELKDFLFNGLNKKQSQEALNFLVRNNWTEDTIRLLNEWRDLHFDQLTGDTLRPLLEYVVMNKSNVPINHLINLYKRCGDRELISQLIISEDDLKVSAHFCHINDLHQSVLTYSFLEAQIDTYLATFVGPNSQQTIQLMLAQLAMSGNDDLLSKIRKYLKRNYPDRKDVDLIISPNFSSFL